MIKITISKEISSKIGYTIIPLLLTSLDSESLFKYVSRHTYIPESYKMLIEQIENNMKHNNLNMTSFTIEKNNGSRTILNKKTKTKTKQKTKLSSKIHQIFIIAINNRSYNNSKYNELLETARITGNAIFNTLKSNQIKSINIIDTIDGNYSNNRNNNSNDKAKIQSLTNSISGNTKFIEAMIEGLCLSSYKFLKYKTDKSLTNEKDSFILSNVNVVIPNYLQKNNKLHNNQINSRFIELQNQIKSVFLARDLINEPANKAKSE